MKKADAKVSTSRVEDDRTLTTAAYETALRGLLATRVEGLDEDGKRALARQLIDGREGTYDKDELERLLYQTDNLFHARVNILLLAETVFLAVAATAWQIPPLLTGIAFLGATTAALCTYTSLKLYWRLRWLIQEFKKYSRVYHDFVTYAGVPENEEARLTRTLMRQRILTVEASRKDTGWILSWGLFWVLLTVWVAIAVARLWPRP